ncbi:MAG: mechanosensitive ion channel family protein [Halioglobus sp.]|nr:mechanosensitive ion channel family protein [Halioglobus sp.]
MKVMLYILLCFWSLTCDAARVSKPVSFHDELDLARLSSPRQTWQSMIDITDAYNQTVQTEGYTFENESTLDNLEEQMERLFDLRKVPESLRRTVAVEAAVYLREIVARMPPLTLESLPGREQAFAEMRDNYPPIWQIDESDIVISYIQEGPFTGNFQFSERTLKLAEELYESVLELPYVNPEIDGFHDAYFMTPGPMIPSEWVRGLPDWMHGQYLGQQVWQWVFMAVGYLFLVLTLYGLHLVIGTLSRSWTEAWQNRFRLLVPLAALLLAARLETFIADEIFITGEVMQWVRHLSAAIWLIAFIGIIQITANLVIARVTTRMSTRSGSVDLQLARFGIRIGSILLAIVVLIQGLSRMGVPLATVLTGAGVTGLAVALAAQESLRNIFGSMMLLLDKPFQVGQRVKVRGHDGTVEEIGIRSTKIRLLNGHVTSIPNDDVAKADIENIGQRPFIRRVMDVTITYDTPPQKIDEAVAIIKDILSVQVVDGEEINHTINRPGYEPRVAFNELNSDSLNIIVIYWYFPPVYWDYMAHATYVNRALIERFNEAGIDFAFPTQTLHLVGDPQRALEATMLDAASDSAGSS